MNEREDQQKEAIQYATVRHYIIVIFHPDLRRETSYVGLSKSKTSLFTCRFLMMMMSALPRARKWNQDSSQSGHICLEACDTHVTSQRALSHNVFQNDLDVQARSNSVSYLPCLRGEWKGEGLRHQAGGLVASKIAVSMVHVLFVVSQRAAFQSEWVKQK